MKVCNTLLVMMFSLLFLSCNNRGNELVGKYKNGKYYAIIENAGDNKFSINSNVSEGGYSSIAEYKEGCLYAETIKGKREIFCKTDKGLVSFNGIKLIREK